MWWIDRGINRPTRPEYRWMTQSNNHPASKTHPSVSKRASSQVLDSYRRLDLTASQIEANLELSEQASDLHADKERLIGDVRALEKTIRAIHRSDSQRQFETQRLRSECDRWLNETQTLSQRLIETTEQYNRLARELTDVRAELEEWKPNPHEVNRAA